MTVHKPSIAVCWFRRDLRLQDHHALYKAFAENEQVLPLFIYDTTILSQLTDKEDRRVHFIHQAISSLQEEITATGGSLHVEIDNPVQAFKNLMKKFTIVAVYANHDYEPYAIQRDKEVTDLLAGNGIPFHTFKDQVIFEKNDILKPDSTTYSIFTPYSVKWKEKLKQQGILHYPSESYLHKWYKQQPTQLPSLAELGFKETNLQVPVKTLNQDIIRNYHNTRNIPAIQGTSNLSVHLRFGTLSIRNLVSMATGLNEQWLNELIWREFFMMILYHHPQVVSQSFKPGYDFIQWRNNEDEFDAWCKGETGYLLVDAGMRELNETGFMHNRVRMVVASFLTKHLLIDWRWGEAYFAEKLLDYDLAANNGNWQWAAGTGADAAPYFRIFNPAEQLKRFDPNLSYVKKWIDINNYHIKPIVDHSVARNRCLQVYKKSIPTKDPAVLL